MAKKKKTTKPKNKGGRLKNVKPEARPTFEDINYLLKQGKIVEYMAIKEMKNQEWREERYRVCSKCEKELKRTQFDGESKYCRKCKGIKKRQSVAKRKAYRRKYEKGAGLQHKCAKQVIYNMKRMGVLKQSICEVCGDKDTFAHHDDYNYPFIVRWLCRKHHMEWHKLNKPIYVKK